MKKRFMQLPSIYVSCKIDSFRSTTEEKHKQKKAKKHKLEMENKVPETILKLLDVDSEQDVDP